MDKKLRPQILWIYLHMYTLIITTEVRAWMSNHAPLMFVNVITYPYLILDPDWAYLS